jgi:hypothetical protein
MAGTFDNAVSFVELQLGSLAANGSVTATTTANADVNQQATYTFPYDVEIVSVAVSAQTPAGGTVVATTGVAFNLTTATTAATMTAAPNLLWSATGTANTSTITSIRVDQGVVSVYCTTATASLATGIAGGDLTGKEFTITGIAEVGTSTLSAGLLAAINGPQVVTSPIYGNGGLANTTGTAIIGFTFGPLKQAAFYNNSNGFWNFTVPSVQATGVATLTEQPFLTTGVTTNRTYLSDNGFSPDLTKTYTRPDGTVTQVSRGFIPAGIPITAIWNTFDTSNWLARGVAITAASNVTMNLAVKKA